MPKSKIRGILNFKQLMEASLHRSNGARDQLHFGVPPPILLTGALQRSLNSVTLTGAIVIDATTKKVLVESIFNFCYQNAPFTGIHEPGHEFH